jgi:hypothetical protein
VSRQKITAGVHLLTDLVENQKYTWEEIDVALVWVVNNRSKFGRDIYSLNLLPHIMEQALGEHRKVVAQQKKQRKAGFDQEALAKQDAQQELLEQKLCALSNAERDHLRSRAIEILSSQGVKAPFLLESVIRSEMLHILSEIGRHVSPSPGEQAQS